MTSKVLLASASGSLDSNLAGHGTWSDPEVAEAALVEFEAFAGSRAQRLPQSAPACAHAAELTRDPELKLSAADALHLALIAEGRHCLVTFDARLADAALAGGFRAEIPP